MLSASPEAIISNQRVEILTNPDQSRLFNLVMSERTADVGDIDLEGARHAASQLLATLETKNVKITYLLDPEAKRFITMEEIPKDGVDNHTPCDTLVA